jgi:polyhydroxyalkanoate synthesis regulator phasin
MLEDVRRNVRGFLEGGVAAVSGKLTPAKARELAMSLVAGDGPRQANRVAQDLLEWSARSRDWINDTVSREVKRQLSALGIATREDLDALRKRVRELERAQPASGGKKSRPRKGSTARTPAKRSPRKSQARKSAAKQSPAPPSSDGGTSAP